MLWAKKNTLNEGHVFVVQGVFVDGFKQLDPKQLNNKTGKLFFHSIGLLSQFLFYNMAKSYLQMHN